MAYPIIFNVTTGQWEEVNEEEALHEFKIPIGPPRTSDEERPSSGFVPSTFGVNPRLWASNESGVPAGYISSETDEMEFDWSSARPLEEEEEEEEEEKRQEQEEEKEEQEFDWASATDSGYQSGLATTFGYNDPLDKGVGAWGDPTNNPDIVGVALPVETLRQYFGDENKAHNAMVEVVNPKTGQTIRAPIVDKGPHGQIIEQQGPTIDLTEGARRQLGGTGKDEMQWKILGAQEDKTEFDWASAKPVEQAAPVKIVDAIDPAAPYMAKVRESPVRRIIMHGDVNEDVDSLIEYGRKVDPSRGFAPGYHFYIGRDGTIKQGAPVDRITNHTLGENSDSIGINIAGADEGKEPTPAQEAAAKSLISQLGAEYGISNKNVFGHGELQPNRRHALEGGTVAKQIREQGYNLEDTSRPSTTRTAKAGEKYPEFNWESAKPVEEAQVAEFDWASAKPVEAGQLKEEKGGTPQNVKGPENRERLLTAISGVEKAGYTVPHFIGTKDEPEGDRAPTRDMEQLVGALAKMEENSIRAEDREGATKIGEARSYWEEQIKTSGMTAEQWKKQTGEEDPRYPHEPAFTAKQSPDELIESVNTAITAGQGTWETAKTELAKVGGALKTGVQSAGLGLGETINRYAYSPIVHGIREAIDFIAPDSDLAKHVAKFDDAFYKNTVEIPAEQRRKLQAGATQGGAVSEVAFTTGQMIGDLPTIMLSSGVLPELKTGIQLVNAMRHGAAAMTVPAMRAGADAAEESKKNGGDALEQLGAFVKATTISMGIGAVPMATESKAATMVGRFGERAAKSVPLASATAETARVTENLVASATGGQYRPFSLEENIKATIPMALLGGVAGRDTRPSKFERTYGFSERHLEKTEWMRKQMEAEGIAKATPEKVIEWEAKWKEQEGQWPEETPPAPKAEAPAAMPGGEIKLGPKAEPAKPEAAVPPEKPTLPRKVHDFLRPKLGIVESPKATKGFEQAKEEAKNIADFLNKTHWTPFNSAIGGLSAGRQKIQDDLRKQDVALKALVPDKEARKGATMYKEANGDIGKLAGWGANTTHAEGKEAYRQAGALSDNARKLVDVVGQRLNALLMEANARGIDVAERENYITHLLQRTDPRSGTPTRGISSYFKYAKPRTYDTLFQALKAGEKPKTLDIVDILNVYESTLRNAIENKKFIDRLKTSQASDGRPILAPSKVRLTDKDWKKIDAPGLERLVVHPEHYDHLRKILSRSKIDEWLEEQSRNPFLEGFKGLAKMGMEAQKYAKGTMFSFSFFHQLTEGTHAVGHRVNPFKLKTQKIDLSDPEQYDAAKHGVMLRPDKVSQEQFMQGVGADSYNLVTKMSRKFGGAAGEKLADMIDGYSHYLFENYIPRLKMDTYRHIVERNTARYAKDLKSGKVSMAEVKSLSADQANAAYGHLNYTKLGRSATKQHIFQLLLLAPDFFEARARFAGQAIKGIAGYRTGTEQLQALALLGLTQYVAARLLNQVDHGDAEWDPEHAFQVKTDLGGILPDKRWVGLRSVPEDLHKALFSGPDKSFQFIRNRLSPFASLASDNLFKTNWRGEKTDFSKALTDMLANIVPLPAQGYLEKFFRPDRAQNISPLETFFKSTGVQIHRVSPINEAFGLAEEWNKKNDPETYERNKASVYPASKYRKLRYALEDSDWEGAKAEAEKLGEGRKVGENFQQSTLRPFTGSMAHDALMYEELDEHDKKIFDAAVERRLMILDRYREQIGPTGKTRVTEATLHKKMREAKLREMKEALKR